MVDQTSQMFITGPDVIKTVTGEDVTMEELAAPTHMAKSGTALRRIGRTRCLRLRPRPAQLPTAQHYADPPWEPAPPHPGAIEDNLTDEDLELDTLIPDSPNQPYDMHEVITRILDDDEFLEVQAGYAPTSSSASVASTADRSASSPISRHISPAVWTSTPPRRPPDSSVPAMRSTFRS